MPKVRVKCPACGKTLTVGQKLLGRPIACPACNKQVVLPALEPAVQAAGELPQFNPPFKTDSIFDEEGPTSVFDEPKPKPEVPVAQGIAPPPTPVPEANPFDFFGGAETHPDAAPPAPAAKSSRGDSKKKDSKFGKSKVQIPTPSNPFGSAESGVSDGSSAPVPMTAPLVAPLPTTSSELRSLSAEDEQSRRNQVRDELRPAREKLPLITWIFLGWALLATGAAVYFALQKPAPAKPAPAAPNAAVPEKEKTVKSDKSREKTEKTDNSQKTAKSEKPEMPDKMDKTEKGDKKEMPDKTDPNENK